MLAFKAAVQAEFERLLTQDVGKALDDKALGKLIAAALEGKTPPTPPRSRPSATASSSSWPAAQGGSGDPSFQIRPRRLPAGRQGRLRLLRLHRRGNLEDPDAFFRDIQL